MESTVKFLNFAISHPPKNKLLKIADVGCGAGEMTRWLADNVKVCVVGIDNDPEQIAKALASQDDRSNITFECLNILSDEVPSDYFDIVYCRFLLHHLPSSSDGVAKLLRMTKRHGKVVIGEPIMDGRWIYPHAKAHYDIYDLHLKNKATHMWDPNYGQKLVSDITAFSQLKINRFEQFRPILATEKVKRHHLLVLELFGAEFVKNGLIAECDLDALKKQAINIAQDSMYYTDLFGLVLVCLDKL